MHLRLARKRWQRPAAAQSPKRAWVTFLAPWPTAAGASPMHNAQAGAALTQAARNAAAAPLNFRSALIVAKRIAAARACFAAAVQAPFVLRAPLPAKDSHAPMSCHAHKVCDAVARAPRQFAEHWLHLAAPAPGDSAATKEVTTTATRILSARYGPLRAHRAQ